MKSILSKAKGITLIALVITIIIIIILAGITINLSIGENGIFTKSKQAREAYQKQAAKETINLKITAVQMETYAQEKRLPTLRDLAENFCQDNDFEDVEERTSTADKDITKISNNPELLMVKLKAYPYEFEIDGELRLASIDGEKIASSETTDEFVLKSEYNELNNKYSQLETNYNNLLSRLETLEQNNSSSNLKMTSPKLLTTVVLEATRDTRNAGTYDASTSLYTKTNTNDFNKYLKFDNNKGWTVQKEGFYFIIAAIPFTSTEANGNSDSKLTINSNDYILTSTSSKSNNYASSAGVSAESSTVYLSEGDIINFKFTMESKGVWSGAYFYIHAMFE